MATPLPPLPGETPEQRRARLSAADAVQARIDAQRQAELDAQEEARRKEMQARIDNMLRSAYVLPPLPQLPVPEMAAPKMAPSIAPMIGNGPLRPTQAQIDAYYATGRGGVWDSVRGVFTTSPYDRAPPLPPQPPLPPIPTYYDPVPPVVQPTLPPIVDIVMKSTPLPVMEPPLMMEPGAGVPPPPKYPTYDTFPSPVPPVDPGFVMDIPTFQPPVRDTTPDFEMQPPMPTPAPMVIEPPVRVVQPKTTSYVPAYLPQPPAKPGELGYVPPMPAPPEPYTPPVFEPYTPPMAEPYTPPSMQFSVDMPRMDYARDLYGVNPDNVSMLKRGGLAVKPKKGKC